MQITCNELFHQIKSAELYQWRTKDKKLQINENVLFHNIYHNKILPAFSWNAIKIKVKVYIRYEILMNC